MSSVTSRGKGAPGGRARQGIHAAQGAFWRATEARYCHAAAGRVSVWGVGGPAVRPQHTFTRHKRLCTRYQTTKDVSGVKTSAAAGCASPRARSRRRRLLRGAPERIQILGARRVRLLRPVERRPDGRADKEAHRLRRYAGGVGGGESWGRKLRANKAPVHNAKRLCRKGSNGVCSRRQCVHASLPRAGLQPFPALTCPLLALGPAGDLPVCNRSRPA